MTWAKLDDRANEHRKQLDAGPEACWLWACGLMYANRQDARDGFIPERALSMLYPFKRPQALAAKLVAVGLWHQVPGGYSIHQFTYWNRSKEQIEAEREATRLRVAKHRNGSSDDDGNGSCNGVTPGTSNGVTNGICNTDVPDHSYSSATPTPLDPPVAPQGGRKKREPRVGTWRRIPEAWRPRPEELAWAHAHWLDVESELAKLRDHEFAKPRTDPDATCRTWFRTAWERKGSPAPRQAKAAPAEDAVVKKARLDAEFAEQRRRELHDQRPIGDESPDVAAAKAHVKQAVGGLF